MSNDSEDFGHTDLVTIDIETGNSSPISQKSYNLSLKYTAWVQKELETLEKAGIIVQDVSLWASPIVVVPKQTQPRKFPRKRLCVDCQALNKLLPLVNKAHPKAKGILTLVPLPKIDEMHAKLSALSIYSTLDLKSGYYHTALSADSQKKIAFMSPMRKIEF